MSNISIKSLEDNNLSFYRTSHYFERYGEFFTVEQFCEYCNWAKDKKIKIYILGNGSNTLFINKKIKSLILKNKLCKEIKPLSNNRIQVTSSVLVLDLLKYCHKNYLDSFYYLASVPATIGGALAMNAGRGKQHQLTIYDFVESVTFFDFESNSVKTLKKEQIVKGYRNTIFTGIHSRLILSATLKFTPTEFKKNPIVDRCKWSKNNQDYSAPNCGSVFRDSDSRILKKLRGLKIGKSSLSLKTNNWILNKSDSSFCIIIIIKIIFFIHYLLGKKAELEIITVD